MIDAQAFNEIIKILKKEGLVKSQRELGSVIGENDQGISDLKSGRKKVKAEHVIALMSAFPTFDIFKYIHDNRKEEFERLKAIPLDLPTLQESDIDYDKIQAILSKPSGIPYYDIGAAAGPITMYSDLKEYIVDYLHLPGFEDCDFSVKVWGDSMAGVFNDGEYILCKEVQDKTMYLPGSAYYIITKEYKTVKFIRKGTKDGFVILRSANDFYEDVEIAFDDIYKIYQIKGAANIRRIAN